MPIPFRNRYLIGGKHQSELERPERVEEPVDGCRVQSEDILREELRSLGTEEQIKAQRLRRTGGRV